MGIHCWTLKVETWTQLNLSDRGREVSYLFHMSLQNTQPNQFKWGFISTHDSKVQSRIAERFRGRILPELVSLYPLSRKTKRWSLLFCSLLFRLPRTPAQRMVPPIFRVEFPKLINLCAQRLFSQVILDSVRLTRDTNHHPGDSFQDQNPQNA